MNILKKKINNEKKGKKFQRNSSSLNKLSLFQKSEGRFNKSCPLSVKNAPIIDYKNISVLKNIFLKIIKFYLRKLLLYQVENKKNLTKEIKKAKS